MTTENETNQMEKLTSLLGKVDGLPTLPSMLGQMNKQMLNPRTSAKEIAQLISSDPAITARVLKVVNSSFYGFPNRITTITHAIVILGFNTVKSIVLSSSIFDMFKGEKKESEAFDRMAFWKHSIGCGAIAKVIGKRLGYPTIEELFIAGLMHDVGKIVLDQYLPKKFVNVMEQVKEKDILLLDAEEEVLGFSHSDVGGCLLDKWNLSKGLIECIRYHHNPMMASDNIKVVSLIHLADILVRALSCGNGGDKRMPRLSEGACAELGLDASCLDDLLKDSGEEIERAMIFLDFI